MLLENQSVRWITNPKKGAGVKVPASCDIVITETSLTITYEEPGKVGICVWKGTGKDGCYNLDLIRHPEQEQGTSTIHYSQDDSCLEGPWWEGVWDGSWRFELDEDLPWVQ